MVIFYIVFGLWNLSRHSLARGEENPIPYIGVGEMCFDEVVYLFGIAGLWCAGLVTYHEGYGYMHGRKMRRKWETYSLIGRFTELVYCIDALYSKSFIPS